MHLNSKLLTTICVLFSVASARTTYDVIVGEGNPPRFLPPYITNVVAGDTIKFIFPPSVHNHSATESGYPGHPACSPSVRVGGVNHRGNVSQVIEPKPLSKDPLQFWFYSQGESDCESGMVFAINPGSEANFSAFKNAAMGI